MKKTNGKSLDFVKNRINNGHCYGININNFDSMEESNFLSVTEKVLKINKELVKFENNTYKFEHLIKNKKDKEFKLNVSVEYNPNAEFEYFATECCVCDGTLCFYISLMENLINKVFSLGTCGKKPKDLEDNLDKYDIYYTVGDFVVCTEFGEQFATKEKPWLLSRFTVMLPIKCEFIEKGDGMRKIDDELIKKIEKAFGFSLYDWQKHT